MTRKRRFLVAGILAASLVAIASSEEIPSVQRHTLRTAQFVQAAVLQLEIDGIAEPIFLDLLHTKLYYRVEEALKVHGECYAEVEIPKMRHITALADWIINPAELTLIFESEESKQDFQSYLRDPFVKSNQDVAQTPPS